ncbi:MAG: deoxyribodipyrimidine photo-lyase, partial [Halohasta sp.]
MIDPGSWQMASWNDSREISASLSACRTAASRSRADPRKVVPEVASTVDADRVVWNRDYTGLARERDAAVRQALNEAEISRESFHDAICHEPGSITTNAGDPYSVFTYFG